MPEWLTILLALAAYLLISRWLFPKLGVPT